MLQPFPAIIFYLSAVLRDLQDKCGSLSRLTLHTDRSTHGCYHILNHRKTKSGTLSGSFCRVKRFKNLLHGIVPDSAAGIGHLQTDHIVPFCLQPYQQFLSLRLFHGLKGIFTQIQQDMLRHPFAS